jgi:hypothetical protein
MKIAAGFSFEFSCRIRRAGFVVFIASSLLFEDTIAEWSTVKAPAVPDLKPVTLDGKTRDAPLRAIRRGSPLEQTNSSETESQPLCFFLDAPRPRVLVYPQPISLSLSVVSPSLAHQLQH